MFPRCRCNLVTTSFPTVQLEQLAFLLVSRQKEGGAYSRVLGGEKAGHVVLCATALRPAMLIDFLNEFYSSSSTVSERRLEPREVAWVCTLRGCLLTVFFGNTARVKLTNRP